MMIPCFGTNDYQQLQDTPFKMGRGLEVREADSSRLTTCHVIDAKLFQRCQLNRRTPDRDYRITYSPDYLLTGSPAQRNGRSGWVPIFTRPWMCRTLLVGAADDGTEAPADAPPRTIPT